MEEIRRSRKGLTEGLAGLSDEEASRAPEPGEWSVKQLLAHINQAERFYVYRAGRAMGKVTEQERERNREQVQRDTAEVAGSANSRPLDQLRHELDTQREETVRNLEALTEPDLATGLQTLEGDETTVLQHLQSIHTHERLHTEQIAKTRSLLAASP